MLQNVMQGKRDSIIDGSVGPVGELVRFQLMISGCLEGPENQALEHFHDHGGQSDWSAVVQACYAGLLGNRHYGGDLEDSGTLLVPLADCIVTSHCDRFYLYEVFSVFCTTSARDLV